MPAGHPSANRFRNTRLRHQAAANMMLVMRCYQCGRTVRFWATDLTKVLDLDHDAHVPPFPCGRCRSKEDVDIQWTVPTAAELAAGLTVRRPVRKIERWLWRDEKA